MSTAILDYSLTPAERSIIRNTKLLGHPTSAQITLAQSGRYYWVERLTETLRRSTPLTSVETIAVRSLLGTGILVELSETCELRTAPRTPVSGTVIRLSVDLKPGDERLEDSTPDRRAHRVLSAVLASDRGGLYEADANTHRIGLMPAQYCWSRYAGMGESSWVPVEPVLIPTVTLLLKDELLLRGDPSVRATCRGDEIAIELIASADAARFVEGTVSWDDIPAVRNRRTAPRPFKPRYWI